jgi:hypothetical protein
MQPRARRRMRVALLLGATLLASACPREEVATPRRSEPAGAARPAPPAPGTARVDVIDGRVRLWSRGAPLLDVLEQLAARAGFELVVVGPLEASRPALQIEDAGLEATLAALLAGVPYRLEDEPDPGTGERQRLRVFVGPPPPVAAAPPAPPAPDSDKPAAETEVRRRLAGLQARIAAMDPEQKRRMQEEQTAWAEALEPELLEQLGDPDPTLRADAVADLPLEGEGALGEERFQRLASILEEDPDPRVRSAALERLSELRRPEALRLLVDGLSDPEPPVVLSAIGALEDADDPSVIPDLEPLLQDSDPEIREAADRAIGWLEIPAGP